MPYPRIDPTKLDCPTLTILGKKDERLPVRKAIDDLLVKIEEKLTQHRFVLEQNMTHFSGFTDQEQVRKVSDYIVSFDRYLKTKDNSALRSVCDPLEKRFTSNVRSISRGAIVQSDSVSVIDHMFKITLPRFMWMGMHWCWFLASKPSTHMRYIFLDKQHIFIKGATDDRRRVDERIGAWVGDTKYKVLNIKLPSVHPAILVWLWILLIPIRYNGVLHIPMISLPVSDDIEYYKLPSADAILRRSDF
jgi:hypothetical protein